MKICTDCQHPNREGELFCVECGNPLLGIPSIATRSLGLQTDTNGQNLEADSSRPGTHRIFGTALLKSDTIVLHITGASEPVILKADRDILIGRSDAQADHYPDLDLTPYGAVKEGVSRIHARFQRSDDTLNIIDLGSANGTFINGQRLNEEQPRILHDGDELRFGRLIARIYFKNTSSLNP